MIYRCLYTGVQPMNVCPGRAWLTIAITVKLIVSKISNHNAFYNFLLGYNALRTLDKMDRNRLLKDNTSLEAVTLIEESDNEVFKLLNYECI